MAPAIASMAALDTPRSSSHEVMDFTSGYYQAQPAQRGAAGAAGRAVGRSPRSPWGLDWLHRFAGSVWHSQVRLGDGRLITYYYLPVLPFEQGAVGSAPLVQCARDTAFGGFRLRVAAAGTD